MIDNLHKLLKDNMHELEENTVYQIMQTHGRLTDCTEFAISKNSHDVIIQASLNEDKF